MISTALNALASEQGLALAEKKGKTTLTRVVAERKAFLSKKKLTYTAWVKVEEEPKRLHFSEMLAESGFGMAGGFDTDMSPGFGFKVETYGSGTGGRSGGIAEQSTLFGKRYQYDFDYVRVRAAVEALAAGEGYAFEYHVTPNF